MVVVVVVMMIKVNILLAMVVVLLMIEDNDDIDDDTGVIMAIMIIVTISKTLRWLPDWLIDCWMLIELQWLISGEEKPQDPSVKQESQVAMSSPLMHIEGLLEALTNADKDGRIVVNKLG